MMNVFEIRTLVIEKIKEIIRVDKSIDIRGWEITCSLSVFEPDCFDDDDYMGNYIRYRVSNHELKKSYNIYHHIHEEKHHCWWYNFDSPFDTTSDDEVAAHLANWILELTKR